jgi:hypothetical protein
MIGKYDPAMREFSRKITQTLFYIELFSQFFERHARCRNKNRRAVAVVTFQRDDGHSYSSYLISFLPETFHDSSPGL